jgi:AcrR family transcriptional regulator
MGPGERLRFMDRERFGLTPILGVAAGGTDRPMPTALRPARLAGEEIREHRHVCALVDGPDDADRILVRFVIEGFEQGDRAFHIVDPELRDALLDRLGANGIDLDAAIASGQLEVRTWADSYVRGGTFDGAAQVEYIRRALDDGRQLGYPRTRLIGSTEWATDEETARALLAYEGRLDDYLRTVPDVVICTYDLNRHSARTIADVIATHPIALVGGVVRTNRSGATPSARERLLAAAAMLFQENGIQATGVDAIIEAAGVAKATFYRHFPSKDDLIVAWLRDPRARWFERVQARAKTSGAGPRDEILLFFEATAEWLETEGYRGCAYLNTSVEITDPAHPARVVIRETLDEIAAYLRERLTAAGYRDAEFLAMQLQALLAGAIALAVARRTGAYALTAREAAAHLLDEAAQRGAAG